MTTKEERQEIIKRKRDEESKQIVVHPSRIEEADDVRQKLKRKVNPTEIEVRKGPGGCELHYLPTHVIINHLNESFGFNNWHSQLLKEEIVHKEFTGGKWQIVTRTHMKITADINGSTCAREDVGWGNSILPSLADALELSSKTATSDALKRCARQFGDYTGNCLYNKQFLNAIK